MKKVVTGAFTTRREAQHAVDRLVDAGFARRDIRVLRSREDSGPDIMSECAPKRVSSRAAVGATAGGTIGGSVGAMIGGMTMLGTMMPPEFIFISEVPFLGMLVGVGMVGALGGFVGACVGLKTWEASTRKLSKRERILILVESSSERAIRAIAIMRGEGSIEVRVY